MTLLGVSLQPSVYCIRVQIDCCIVGQLGGNATVLIAPAITSPRKPPQPWPLLGRESHLQEQVIGALSSPSPPPARAVVLSVLSSLSFCTLSAVRAIGYVLPVIILPSSRPKQRRDVPGEARSSLPATSTALPKPPPAARGSWWQLQQQHHFLPPQNSEKWIRPGSLIVHRMYRFFSL